MTDEDRDKIDPNGANARHYSEVEWWNSALKVATGSPEFQFFPWTTTESTAKQTPAQKAFNAAAFNVRQDISRAARLEYELRLTLDGRQRKRWFFASLAMLGQFGALVVVAAHFAGSHIGGSSDGSLRAAQSSRDAYRAARLSLPSPRFNPTTATIHATITDCVDGCPTETTASLDIGEAMKRIEVPSRIVFGDGLGGTVNASSGTITVIGGPGPYHQDPPKRSRYFLATSNRETSRPGWDVMELSNPGHTVDDRGRDVYASETTETLYYHLRASGYLHGDSWKITLEPEDPEPIDTGLLIATPGPNEALLLRGKRPSLAFPHPWEEK